VRCTGRAFEMSQNWPLSQLVNKSNGTCSICFATRQLHLRDGTIHRHGPRHDPCPGSNKPPLPASSSSVNTPFQSSSADVNTEQPSRSSAIWSPTDISLIKHIPKSARPSCATHLASLLRKVVSSPDSVTNWLDIFNWGNVVLHPPKRGGKRHRLSTTVKHRIATFTAGRSVTDSVGYTHAGQQQVNSTATVSQAVSAKLEDGNVRAAIRILMSDDSPAVPSPESFNALSEKHPAASSNLTELPAPRTDQCLSVDESEVRRAVLSFPAGSAAGPDGLRPQHIRDMLLCREAGAEFLSALTDFVNLVIAGLCPSNVAPILFGGRLLALSKKTGGIRPIAIGFTLRRLASKCANSFGTKKLASFFYPHQLGVGTPGGCEAAVHSARRYLEALPQGHVLVKLDFTNAFNSIHRNDMLLAVHSRIPELYAFCRSAYSQPSHLFFGSYTISSEEGAQQGDPIGPLLFCNTIHPMLTSLQSELNLDYLDDVTLGGPVETVASDVAEIVRVGSEMGLSLNVGKCELIAQSDLRVTDTLLDSFIRMEVNDTVLLGAALFPGPALDREWDRRLDDLARAVDRLGVISSQDALILLRSSFSAPKVLHLLRCSPSAGHPALERFDSLLRRSIQNITNSDLSDVKWLQASLPVRDGGLGVRRVSSLAIPAFLASAASTLSLQDDILSDCAKSGSDFLQSYLSAWTLKFGDVPDELPTKQPFWDRPGVLEDKKLVEASLNSAHQQASFLAASFQHSGDWLFALPIASCGLKLDDEAVRIAVGLRLGLDLCVPHQCHCSSQVDARGLHSFVCKRAPGRSARHHALNDLIARSFASAGTPVTKEPVGMFRTDGKRPDGLTLVPWRGGKSLCWDVTVTCPLAESYVNAAAREAGAAAELAASRKEEKYRDIDGPYIFEPIAVETLGIHNESARQLLSDLGRRISESSGDARETSFLFQRISVLVQRFNAVLLHDSMPVSDFTD